MWRFGRYVITWASPGVGNDGGPSVTPYWHAIFTPLFFTTSDSRQRQILGLPLNLLPGWLFGLTPSRARPEFQGKLERYREECFDVLWAAYQTDALTLPGQQIVVESPAITALTQIREMGRAIMQMAEEQIMHERRISTVETRLDTAARVVGNLERRMRQVEDRVVPGKPVSEQQAAEVQNKVRALALFLTEQDASKNHFQSVFSTIYTEFGVSSYKSIRQGDFAEVMALLDDWYERLTKRNRTQ
jgi:hypothetical protein